MSPDSDGSPVRPTVLVLMGVSGAGKTTVGRAVADRLGWAFFDADDLHPPENVAKMARGEGLTDADRSPWLDAVRALIDRRVATEAPAVIACSALKARYRERLGGGDEAVAFVWLDVEAETLAQRLADRAGHFAGPDLLASQLEALEPPAPSAARRITAVGTVGAVAQRVIDAVASESP